MSARGLPVIVAVLPALLAGALTAGLLDGHLQRQRFALLQAQARAQAADIVAATLETRLGRALRPPVQAADEGPGSELRRLARREPARLAALLRHEHGQALIAAPDGELLNGRTRERRALPPAGIAGGQAVAVAPLGWQDPAGPWRLVLVEDLSRTVPWTRLLPAAALAAVLALLIGAMGWHLLDGRRRRRFASEQLDRVAAEREATSAFRAELSRLAGRLQRCERLPELAAAYLTAARELHGSLQGAVYVASRDQPPRPPRLLLAGSAAAGDVVPPVLALGEGLLGQCAQDRALRILNNPPAGPWRLRSGLGHGAPGALLVAPLVLQDELVGVVELALPRLPDAAGRGRLEDLLALLTNSLEILRRSERAWLSLPQPLVEAAAPSP